MSKPHILVVASDGVYDGLSNKAVAVHAVGKGTEEQRAYDMLKDSLENKSGDNMAAIVIDLKSNEPPQDAEDAPVEEAQEKSDENDPAANESKDEL